MDRAPWEPPVITGGAAAPSARTSRRRSILIALAALFGAFAVTAVIFVAAALVALNAIVIDLGRGRVDGRPTPEEYAVAATTLPPPPDACRSFRAVMRTGEATARANFDLATGNENFAAYRSRLERRFEAFDAALRDAIASSVQPMRGHIVATRRALRDARAELASARSLDDSLDGGRQGYAPWTAASTGYDELWIADALLGRTCRGILVPSSNAAFDALAPAPGPASSSSTVTTSRARE